MNILIYSKSTAFEQYIRQAIDLPLRHHDRLDPSYLLDKTTVCIVHSKSYPLDDIFAFLSTLTDTKQCVAIADDFPTVPALLQYTQRGIRGYCNSYMASPHYQQLVSLLTQGQSWFPPQLVEDVFALAAKQFQPEMNALAFKTLTAREQQVAYKIAEGKNNKVIASELMITERTVKSHLSHIFKKLGLKDRMALALYINSQGLTQTGT